jgi:prolipoprotein diacylglyceryltransferase
VPNIQGNIIWKLYLFYYSWFRFLFKYCRTKELDHYNQIIKKGEEKIENEFDLKFIVNNNRNLKF